MMKLIEKVFTSIEGDTTIKYVLPEGWSKCFKSDSAMPFTLPDMSGDIVMYATQTPYQVIISNGKVYRNWVDTDVTPVAYEQSFTFDTIEQANECYNDTQDPELCDMFFN